MRHPNTTQQKNFKMTMKEINESLENLCEKKHNKIYMRLTYLFECIL